MNVKIDTRFHAAKVTRSSAVARALGLCQLKFGKFLHSCIRTIAFETTCSWWINISSIMHATYLEVW